MHRKRSEYPGCDPSDRLTAAGVLLRQEPDEEEDDEEDEDDNDKDDADDDHGDDGYSEASTSVFGD